MSKPSPAGQLRSVSIPLVLGDVAMFAVFAVVGVRSHEEALTAGHVARAGLPFVIAWLVVGWFTHAFNRPAGVGMAWRSVLLPLAPTCLFAVAARSLLLGRPLAPTFAVIAYATNAVLLGGWRTLFAVLSTRGQSGEATAENEA